MGRGYHANAQNQSPQKSTPDLSRQLVLSVTTKVIWPSLAVNGVVFGVHVGRVEQGWVDASVVIVL